MQCGSLPATGRTLHRVDKLWRDLSNLSLTRNGGGPSASKNQGQKREACFHIYAQKRRRHLKQPVQASRYGASETEEVPIAELKAQLLDSLFGTERGFTASSEVRAEISELVSQLEAQNPTPSPNEELELLDGAWRLVYTSNSELEPLLALGRLPMVRIGDIVQHINSKTLTVENKAHLTGPLSTASVCATASLEISSPKRLQVAFKRGRVTTPELLQDAELPNTVSLLGVPIDLTTLKEALQPVKSGMRESVSRLSEMTKQLPALDFPIPAGERAQSWLLNTYLDSDMRISRGDGGSIFILTKIYYD